MWGILIVTTLSVTTFGGFHGLGSSLSFPSLVARARRSPRDNLPDNFRDNFTDNFRGCQGCCHSIVRVFVSGVAWFFLCPSNVRIRFFRVFSNVLYPYLSDIERVRGTSEAVRISLVPLPPRLVIDNLGGRGTVGIPHGLGGCGMVRIPCL